MLRRRAQISRRDGLSRPTAGQTGSQVSALSKAGSSRMFGERRHRRFRRLRIRTTARTSLRIVAAR